MADVKFERVTDIRTPHEDAVTIIGNTAEGRREVEIPAFDVSGVIMGLASMFPQLKGAPADAGIFKANGFQVIGPQEQPDLVVLDFDIKPNGLIRIAVPSSWLDQMSAGLQQTARALAIGAKAPKH